MDDGKQVLECTTSNIFCYNSGVIYTPTVGVGVFVGIFRKKFIDFVEREQISLKETYLDFNSLCQSEGVFTTNAVKGVSSVEQIDDTLFEISGELNLILAKFTSNLL